VSPGAALLVLAALPAGRYDLAMKFFDRLSIEARTRIDLAALSALLAFVALKAGATLAAVTAPLTAAALYSLALLYGAPETDAAPVARRATMQWVIGWVLLFVCIGAVFETLSSVEHHDAKLKAQTATAQR
jgi:hypothetical protein